MPLDNVAQVLLLIAVWIILHMFTKSISETLAYDKKKESEQKS